MSEETFDLTDKEVFQLIQTAYVRGAYWAKSNPTTEDIPYLSKAAYDYADKTTGGLPRKSNCPPKGISPWQQQ